MNEKKPSETAKRRREPASSNGGNPEPKTDSTSQGRVIEGRQSGDAAEEANREEGEHKRTQTTGRTQHPQTTRAGDWIAEARQELTWEGIPGKERRGLSIAPKKEEKRA